MGSTGDKVTWGGETACSTYLAGSAHNFAPCTCADQRAHGKLTLTLTLTLTFMLICNCADDAC